MTWRGTALFALAVAAVGLYAWWSAPPGPVLRRDAAKHPLLNPHVEITRVVLTAASGTVPFTRDDGEWHAVVAGTPVSIDVDSLLATLRSVGPLMVVGSAPADLERFGLAPPAVRLELWAGAQPVLRLDCGSRNPAWTALYTRRDDRPEIELVGAVLYWEIEKLLAATGSRAEA